MKITNGKEEATYINTLGPTEFLNYILVHGNPTKMNHVIQNHGFDAYTITKNCYHIGQVSFKQRLAIANIYMYAKYGYRFDYIMDDEMQN